MNEWQLSHFLGQAGVIVVMSLLVQKGFLFRRFSFLYLALIPGVVLFQGQIEILIWGILMGLFSYSVWRNGKLMWIFILGVALVGGLFFFGGRIDAPRMAAELGMINAERGEHLLVGDNLGRLFHNKLDLGYFTLKRIEDQVSMAALFAGGRRNLLAEIFPVGYLFWWDIVFLIRYLIGKTKQGAGKLGLIGVLLWLGISFIGIGWLSGVVIEGLIMGVVYFWALLVLEEMNGLSEIWFKRILILDLLAILLIIYLAKGFVV